MPAAASLALRRGTAADRDGLAALQVAAYEPNRIITGRMPIPVTWDFGHVLAAWEVWLAEDEDGLVAALILEPRAADLYIQSIAVAPQAKGQGVGNALLDFAEARARSLARPLLRLIANALMEANVAWYGRKGFVIEDIVDHEGRRVVHMAKPVAPIL